mgnify:CR=1 FL=1
MNETDFWASIEKRPDGCWIWTRAQSNGGYGFVSYRGSTHPAHRLAWRLTKGPIPQGTGYHGTIVAHKCDNRLCCNPDHLFLTDQSGNLADCVVKGRNPNAKLTKEKVLEIVSLIKSGKKASAIATQFDVSMMTIHSIAKGRAWRHVTKDLGELKFKDRSYDPESWRTADYAKIRSMLKSGKTLRQIARECNTTWPTVRRVADSFKELVSSPFSRTTDADRERIRDLKANGISQPQISKWLGRSQATVSRVVNGVVFA